MFKKINIAILTFLSTILFLSTIISVNATSVEFVEDNTNFQIHQDYQGSIAVNSWHSRDNVYLVDVVMTGFINNNINKLVIPKMPEQAYIEFEETYPEQPDKQRSFEIDYFFVIAEKTKNYFDLIENVKVEKNVFNDVSNYFGYQTNGSFKIGNKTLKMINFYNLSSSDNEIDLTDTLKNYSNLEWALVGVPKTKLPLTDNLWETMYTFETNTVWNNSLVKAFSKKETGNNPTDDIPTDNNIVNTDKYTNVIDDLNKDSKFDVNQYPYKKNNYNLNVIQIAESSAKELYIYVYQPFQKQIATSINISTTVAENVSFKNYKLEFLSSNSVFFKYKVTDFIIKNDDLRYYQISAIFRKYIDGVDPINSNGNTTNEVSLEVGKLFTAKTFNGNTSYSMSFEETINIMVKYVGFVRYSKGFRWNSSYLLNEDTDSHYVAFSTDKPMDDLLEADIQFISQYKWNLGSEPEKTNNLSIKKTDTVSNSSLRLFSDDYQYSRVQKVDDFIGNEKLNESTVSSLENCTWVLRFLETDRISFINYKFEADAYRTEVSNVQILRLKYMTDGVVYNLGVVDNKTTGDKTPDNIPDTIVNLLIDKIKAFFEKIKSQFGLDTNKGLIVIGLIAVVAIGVQQRAFRNTKTLFNYLKVLAVIGLIAILLFYLL
jgi:hypothetical protein